ncbi:MAG: SDR family oxidoreductase [Chlamydiia bacterium]|nr:SDR family oxidoreductase [Chlamydiia bacterium]
MDKKEDPSAKVVMPSPEILTLLKGQIALVTGANTGIGKAVAISLAQAGASVAINYYAGDSEAEQVVEEIKKYGVDSYAYKADVSNEHDVIAMFADIKKKWGTIDILVNNAGIQKDAPIDTMTLDDWNAVIHTNLTSQFLCSREAIKEFKRRGVVQNISCAAGKIICMSSVHQMIPWAGHVNYAASKGGIHLLMMSLAQEVARFRIRVNAIAPGAIRTHINQGAWDTKEALDSLMHLIPYKRIGEPEDIGRCAAWLVSDHADYLTGTTIFVDGGMTLFPGFTTGG